MNIILIFYLIYYELIFGKLEYIISSSHSEIKSYIEFRSSKNENIVTNRSFLSHYSCSIYHSRGEKMSPSIEAVSIFLILKSFILIYHSKSQNWKISLLGFWIWIDIYCSLRAMGYNWMKCYSGQFFTFLN